MHLHKKMRGYTQVYTGDGMGHTEAAVGLALRAAGAGLKVVITCFGMPIGVTEFAPLKAFAECIEIKRFDNCRQISGDRADFMKLLREARQFVGDNKYDVVILLDANTAAAKGDISKDTLIDICSLKADETELVLTGNDATAEILEMADLVTEMKDITASKRKTTD